MVKICTRSGQHVYNVALFASMIAHHGEKKAESWLNGVKATWRASLRAMTAPRPKAFLQESVTLRSSITITWR